MSLEATNLARARHRLYAVLGQLLVDAPDEALLVLARAVPALAEVFPLSVDDDLAARHYAMSTEVPAVASALLGAGGHVGGPIADQIAAAYREGGFHPGRTDVPSDHTGLALAFVGHLCAAEAEARSDGADEAVIRLCGLQATFLQQQLLQWLPAWVVAIEALGDPAYGTVAALALELAASHATATAGHPLAGDPLTLDTSVGLEGIGEALTIPARSGWVLGRTTLSQACNRAEIAAGLGSRGTVCGRALRGAASLGQLAPLATELLAALDRYDGALKAHYEALNVPVAPWRARLSQTRTVLATLVTASQDQSPRMTQPETSA